MSLLEELKKKLEDVRHQLLDMGMRGNAFLNFRGGARTLNIVDGKSGDAYRLLVDEGKKMSFLPAPEDPELVPNEGQKAGRNLQTNLLEVDLDKRLIRIDNEAKTYLKERGVDVLYLALGFLTWVENSKERKAPLVLVPVDFERTAHGKFKIEYTGADIGTNLTLRAKLRQEFKIELPDIGDDFNFDLYLDSIENNVANQKQWCVNRNDIHLGFFSFGRFQMYQDLDPKNWPNVDKHPVLPHLLVGDFSGAGDAGGIGGEGTYAAHDPSQLHFVKDADLSQTEAILAAKDGKHLVIQGPPGTGKSQTITNIIAEFLANNKRVLFVSEKMAALEVVKRRLDQCRLGDAVLELHSHKSNKKQVLAELKRTLESDDPRLEREVQARAQRYTKLKDKLDKYSDAVNKPILNSGISYIYALGKVLQLRQIDADIAWLKLAFKPMRGWTKKEFQDARESVEQMASHLQRMQQSVADSVFKNSQRSDFDPMEKDEQSGHLRSLVNRLNLLIDESRKLMGEMGLNVPLAKLIYMADWVQKGVLDVSGLDVTVDDWQTKQAAIVDLLKSGQSMSAVNAKRAGQLHKQAWKQELQTTRQIWVDMRRKWLRKLSSKFRQAEAQVQGLLINPALLRPDEVLALIDDILEYQNHRKTFDLYAPLGQKLFGNHWQDAHSNWDTLEQLRSWVTDTRKQVANGHLPSEFLAWISANPPQQDWSDKFAALFEEAKAVSEQVMQRAQVLGFHLDDQDESLEADSNLIEMHKQVKSWCDNLDEMFDIANYNRLKIEIEDLGLSALVEFCYACDADSAKQLVSLFELIWYQGLIKEAYKRKPLKEFRRQEHEDCIKQFKELDKGLLFAAQDALAARHYDSLPEGAGGEMRILQREMAKQKRIMPIRRLLSEAGESIQEIKPVFMMSPTSVATYLEPEAVDFDLVVFDEASQVRIEDAISPLLRARQAVIVGDDKQMPPSDWFRKTVESDEEEDREIEGMESVLGQFAAKAAPQRMLRWHYRSRHHSLIAVSNREFYNGRLMIFPSSGRHPYATGLTLRHCPDNLYDRAGSKTNPKEARQIAEAVLEHAKKHPDLSLGVVAFSISQLDCILLEAHRLRGENSELQDFWIKNRKDGENFFIKNLENVQGDERDIIFISIGYGQTDTGFKQDFGNVIREERRLNVLFTRSKLSMVVFSSFTEASLKIGNSTPTGVRALKTFLHYAENKEYPTAKETGREPDSPFELDVKMEIEKLGYEVEPQVGSAGFFIDLAVRHPEKLGQYILAVECDGASYHSSASARDRDRLRQEVLEDLRWKFHRIWSTDWFKNRDAEIKRLKDSIEQHIALADKEDEKALQPELLEDAC